MGVIFFNLLVNSILSLILGLILVFFFIWFFRIQVGHWKIALLSLPFVKLVFDFAKGIPEKSVLFSGVDPFALPPKHQILSIGLGLDGWWPTFKTGLSVNGLDGQIYNSSIGDYVALWISQEFGPQMALILVSVILTGSALLLLVRFVQYGRFENERRKDRLKSPGYRILSVGRRSVDVYISSHFSGTPFTGGLLRPYICLPEDAVQKLIPEELDAVIAHEVGHIRFYDLLVTVLIQCLGDLFWFVPGYRWLSRKIDRLREVVADSWAVSQNIDPQFLASALVKLKEIPEKQGGLVLYSAFFREKSLLKERVERLMGHDQENKPRFGWQYSRLRWVVALFIAIFVLNSVLGGNFWGSLEMTVPESIRSLWDTSCICINHKFYALV